MKAELLITTALRYAKTILKDCFYTSPFKVINITEDRRAPTLHLMLMNASPGVLDGDCYTMQLNVAAGCSLQLHTQSYQRLFQMKGAASQRFDVNLAAGSAFCFLPHPSVPHEGSNFTAKNKFYLSQGCTLIWGEVLTCGRSGSSEQFLFSKYHSCTEIFLNERLVVKENVWLQPAVFDVSGLGQLEGYTHQASLIYLNEAASIPEVTDMLHEVLLHQKGICFGVTALPVNGFVLRVLGYHAEHLHGLLKKVAGELKCISAPKQPEAIKKEILYAS